MLEVFGNDSSLGGDADNLAASFGEAQSFLHAGGSVTGVTGEHALHHHGRTTTDLDVSNHDGACFATLVVVEVGAVAEERRGHGAVGEGLKAEK